LSKNLKNKYFLNLGANDESADAKHREMSAAVRKT
jgi:hypothetical protein